VRLPALIHHDQTARTPAKSVAVRDALSIRKRMRTALDLHYIHSVRMPIKKSIVGISSLTIIQGNTRWAFTR
jgi:hypothetical protein